jgi:outer membrane immunogenic protein
VRCTACGKHHCRKMLSPAGNRAMESAEHFPLVREVFPLAQARRAGVVFSLQHSDVRDSWELHVIALSQFNSDRRAGSRSVAAVVTALAAVPAAFAADLPAPPTVYSKAPAPIAYDWTGFYLGAGVGARSSQVDGDVSQASINSFSFAGTGDCVPGSFFFPCSGESLNGTALRISPYFGYNYQFATQWLVGIEGDVGFGSKATTLANAFYPNTGITNFDGHDSFAVKTGWDASLRGRLGFLVTPSFLVYGTGGAAWQHIDATSTCSAATNNFSVCAPGFLGPSVVTDSTTKPGYTIGAGIEAMLWHNWIVRGEYRYADFGTISNTETRTCGPRCATPINLAITDTLHLKTQTATFGIAYKFN